MDKLEKKFFELIRNGGIKQLKIDEMKEFLSSKNLPTKGKKDFLMEIIEEYFE
jgi:hypothetical protein